MNIIHHQNVAFRCRNTLKEKLQAYAEEHDIRVSSVIRNACVDFLRKELPDAHSSPPTSPSRLLLDTQG
jgi:hypothetical protein